MTDANDIVVAQRAPLSEPVIPERDGTAAPVSAVLKRRWRVLLLVTTACAVVSLSTIWATMRPRYEVRAQLRVAPVVPPILFNDSDTDISRQYGVHMATQAKILVSPAVVHAALESPEVRSLPSLRGAEDPVGEIGRRLAVKQEPGTELLWVTMTGEAPEDMAVVVNGLLATYLRLRENKKRESDDKIVSSLRAEQGDLQVKLDRKSDQLRRLAAQDGLSSAEQARAAVDDWVSELRQLLAQADRDRAIAESKLELLGKDEDGDYLIEDDPAAYEQYLQADPELQDLRTALRALELASLEDERYGRGPDHPEVSGRAGRIAALREAIDTRASRLRELYRASMHRRLEAERLKGEMTAKLYQERLDGWIKRRTDVARQAFVLDDLHHERQRLEGALTQVRQTIWKVEVEQNRMARVTVESPAFVPRTPNLDKRIKYSAAALIASLFLGAGVAVLRHRADTSVREPGEVTDRLGMPLLGSIQRVPNINGLGPVRDERILEPLRGISAALLASSGSGRTHSRLITSPTARSGKSSLAINLARSLAATGRRVLLVDADNSGQGVTRACEMTGRVGLKELLENTCRREDAVQESDMPGLRVVPAGQHVEQFGAILARRAVQENIRSLFEGYEEVIVDSPPVLASSNAVVLATLVDEVVLVLRAGKSTREEAHAARHYLSTVGGKLVGVILNAVDPKTAPYAYYGYAYAGSQGTGHR